MTGWTDDQLGTIGDAEEIRVASLRRDGELSKPRIVWVVRVGDDLYVRSVKGAAGDWFRSTQVRHEGRVTAGGVAADVSFAEDHTADDQIDAEYRRKYRRYAGPIVDSVLTPQARATTLKLLPRSGA